MAADLGPELARKTADAGQPVQALALGAAAEHGRSDAAWAARVPALLSLARHVGDSRSELDRIRSELGRFQTQLGSASEHIQTLQDRASVMDAQLRTRAREESELASYLDGVVLSPRVARLLLSTPIDGHVDEWVDAVRALDAQLRASSERSSAFAAGELPPALREASAVALECKNAAVSKIRAHLISLFEPIRTSIATTLQIRQSSVLLPANQPLYHFLATHAPRVAVEIQLAYINAVRLYYEAAFRQYARDLRRIHARWHEPNVPLGQFGAPFPPERLECARPDGAAPVILAYMAEDAAYTASPEALFRTMSMAFIDNACSEYAFLARFFGPEAAQQPPAAIARLTAEEQEELAPHSAITHESWRQAMEPAIFYWNELAYALLDDTTRLLPLLCMVTLADAHLDVARTRGCLAPELEHTLMRFLIEGWSRVARAFDAEADSVRALEPARAQRTTLLGRLGALAGGSTDLAARGDVLPQLRTLVSSYVALYKAVSALCTPQHENTLLGGMARVRAEIMRLMREYAVDARDAHELCAYAARELAQEANEWERFGESLGH